MSCKMVKYSPVPAHLSSRVFAHNCVQVLAETQQREEEEGDEEQKPIETQRVQTSTSATDNKKAGKKKGEDHNLLNRTCEFQLCYVLT